MADQRGQMSLDVSLQFGEPGRGHGTEQTADDDHIRLHHVDDIGHGRDQCCVQVVNRSAAEGAWPRHRR
ncbi:MAG: hypothetical protein R2854_03460 [Caldilineaceae bacterium]